ncbi:glycosyltransferase family 4 protein [Bacillus massilinigeriensis]|uniref:glycosyltransferase family 4 protein n=1 Tax=Bacillus massilionigeriensis TaxID=1805475 RepID=UPI00096AEB9E|nr:glycosyltransferase family 4 protein [Bacillus massilionigeriensis]
MNLLFLTLANMDNVFERGIYTDLVRELARRGVNVYIVYPGERRSSVRTKFTKIDNIHLLKVRTGNITKTNIIEKGISTLTIEGQYLRAIKKYLRDIQFNLVLYSTPPITFASVVKYLKKQGSKTYLMLKDIFPQNAVDINMIKEKGIIWRYFRRKEKSLYEVSDTIGCMSKGNVEYLLQHNSFINHSKVEIFPNAIEPVVQKELYKSDARFLEKYHISKESTLFVYGGNLGKPQGIDFLLQVVDHFHKIENGFLMIVGSGTEYERIENHIKTFQPKNVCLINSLPKNEYDLLLERAEVGLIFLDKRFTIPNIPSRLTAYMEYSLPILAATDKNTDLKEILLESNSGLWLESGDIELFIEHARTLVNDVDLRKQMGSNGRRYLEYHFDIKDTVQILLNHC